MQNYVKKVGEKQIQYQVRNALVILLLYCHLFAHWQNFLTHNLCLIFQLSRVYTAYETIE